MPPAERDERQAMIEIRLAIGVIGVILMVNRGRANGDDVPKRLTYPAAPRADTVDDYHGTKVPDPFRPLEDPDAPATRAWIDQENQVTFGFLESIPERGSIRRRLTELWDYERYGVPLQEG